jgi:hypothetical protein
MHEVLKAMFLWAEKEVAGQVVRYSRSTAGLSTIEFEDFCGRIREWASVSLSVFLPLPNEVSI